MMKVRLTKISSSHSRLRTDEVVGGALCEPLVGRRFTMWAPPLSAEADYREVSTSPVKSIDGKRFTTENSVYEFEVL